MSMPDVVHLNDKIELITATMQLHAQMSDAHIDARRSYRWSPPSSEPGRPMVREERMHHSAEALCGIVLARSLEAWGLAGVTTDDATGRGDKK
jgi:hypothetical protein